MSNCDNCSCCTDYFDETSCLTESVCNCYSCDKKRKKHKCCYKPKKHKDKKKPIETNKCKTLCKDAVEKTKDGQNIIITIQNYKQK